MKLLYRSMQSIVLLLLLSPLLVLAVNDSGEERHLLRHRDVLKPSQVGDANKITMYTGNVFRHDCLTEHFYVQNPSCFLARMIPVLH